jgi:hypothetical protein
LPSGKKLWSSSFWQPESGLGRGHGLADAAFLYRDHEEDQP